MSDRNRYSRWRRLPPVFRSGEHRVPGYEDEAQRLTLYLPGGLLDLAEDLAELANVPTIQEYCARLLALALENERARWRVAEAEAKQGPFEGLRAIAQDSDYLAEWRPQDGHPHNPQDETADGPGVIIPVALEPTFVEPEDEEPDETTAPDEAQSPLTVRLETKKSSEPVVAQSTNPELLDGRPMELLWRHVAPGDQSSDGFLPRLRRGESVPPAEAAALLKAIGRLDEENRGAQGLDRRLAYALYRLALESQVLMTEVWPGAFDESTVEAIRAAQEMVERVLSDDDGRIQEGPESQAGEGGS